MSGAETCGAPHPGRPGVVCDRDPHDGVGYHRNRATGEVWEAAPLPRAPRTGRGALAEVAARTRRPRRAGDASEAVEEWRRERH